MILLFENFTVGTLFNAKITVWKSPGKENMTLDKLETGKKATVVSLLKSGKLRRRLLDIGIFPGAKITAKGKAPFGGPMIFDIGNIVALRTEDAAKIVCKL